MSIAVTRKTGLESGNSFGVFLILWNRLQNYTTPALHFKMGGWLEACWRAGRKSLVLQAFRGSGKSSLCALFIVWLLLQDPDLRILVLAAEQELAAKMARNMRRIILTHPMTRDLIPESLEEWAAERFTVRRTKAHRDPSVIARGLMGNITGLRADVIIYDDVEVPNTCESAAAREDLRARISESGFILTPGGTQIFIGTPHTFESIYRNDKDVFLKNFTRLNVPVYNENCESAWPERFTNTDIERLKTQSGPQKFASQMMLRPVNIAESRLNPDLLVRYEDEIETHEAQQILHLSLGCKKLISCSAWWDPAFGHAGGDSSVLAIVFSDEAGR